MTALETTATVAPHTIRPAPTRATWRPRLGRILMNLLLAGIDVYALSMILFMLLRLITGTRLWQVLLVENLLSWMLLPSVPLLIVVALLRRWRRAALVGPVAASFLALYGAFFLPNLNAATACSAGPECRRLTVMSYNLLGDERPDVDAQVALIRESGAEIVALQEVSERAAAAIERDLADLYPYRILEPRGIPGTGLLSKYPILESEVFQLTPGYLYQGRAVIDWQGQPVTVFSAHPPAPGFVQGRYTSFVHDEGVALAAMTAQNRPALLLGDFNITDQAADYRLFAEAGLADAYREAGWGFGYTFPTRLGSYDNMLPLVRLDYIFTTCEFRAIRAWVGEHAGADHLPLYADLAWQRCDDQS